MSFNISVLIPAYNEALNLPKLLPELYQVLSRLAADFEIILIDDGSTDNTQDLVPGLRQAYPKLVTLHNPKNTGYGNCLKTGIALAKYDFFSLVPGNCKFKPEELQILSRAISDFDVVLGYRTQRADSFKRKLFTRWFKILIKQLFKITFKDIHWVKLYRTAALKALSLKSRSIAVETEITLKLLHSGKTFTEIELSYLPRQQGHSSADKLSNLAIFIKEIIVLKLAAIFEH
jgi:glycosyltransferase involved in cell wall biosynthesis